MITYLNYQKILELYKNYFKTISKERGRYTDNIPYITTTEKYFVLDNFNKDQTFYQNIIAQPVFNTIETQKLFEILNQSTASTKSLFTKYKNINDPFKIDGDDIDNLLQSFGFPILIFPEYIERILLLELVSNYKIKGTLQSVENILNIISPNKITISEVYFKKIEDNPYFVENIEVTAPGIIGQTTELLVDTDSYTVNDQHWWLTKNDLKNWDVGRAMTPYFSINSIVSPFANNSAVTILRTYAVKDYDILQNGTSSEYEDTKILSLENLPDKINYLELYELIRYIVIKNENIQDQIHDDPNKLTYSYEPPDEDYDIIVDNLNADYNKRYAKDFGTIESETTNCTIRELIKTIPILNNPGQGEIFYNRINDLVGASSTKWKNKVILVGGKFQSTGNYNTNLYIFDIYDTSYFSVNIGLELLNPIVTSGKSCNYVCVTGGFNPDGTKNYRNFMINLNNYTITEVTGILETMWMNNPVTASNEDLTYVISTDPINDTCPGGIYIWNVCSNYKKFIAMLDTEVYDLSSIKAFTDRKNRLYIFIRSTLSAMYHVILLDPDPRYEIFIDITCLLLSNVEKNVVRNIYNALSSGRFLPIPYDDKIALAVEDNGLITFVVIEPNYEESNIKRKLVPRYMSGMLLPSRICKTCPTFDDSGNLIAECSYDFSRYKTEVTGIENYHGHYFVHVKRYLDGQICLYWPLVQTVYQMCCNSPNLRINKFLPSSLYYDQNFVYFDYTWSYNKYSSVRLNTTEGINLDCYFYFMYFNETQKIIGNHNNADDYTFADIYKLPNISPFYDENRGYDNSNLDCHTSNICYLYDTCKDYDIDDIKIIAYSTYPDSPFSDLDDKKYFELYKNLELPEFITLTSILQQYSVDINWFNSISFISKNTEISFCYQMEDPSGTGIQIIRLYPKLLKFIFENCNLTYIENTDYARDFRKQKLEERGNRYEHPEQLPAFNDFNELNTFLTNVTPNNKMTIDTSENTDKIFFELLNIASSLFPESNLTLLFPNMNQYINPVIDMFKPIHSRYLGIKNIFSIADPIGDWITMEDSIEFFKFRRLVSWIYMQDCILRNITKHTENNIILLSDELNEEARKNIIDGISLSDSNFYNIWKSFFDFIIVRDSFMKNMNTSFSDTINLHDLIEFSDRKSLFDILGISDFIFRNVTKTIDEYASLVQNARYDIGESYDNTLAFLYDVVYKNITKHFDPDRISMNDFMTFGHDLTFRDTASLNELIDLILTKTVSDHISLSDSFITQSNRSFIDHILLLDKDDIHFRIWKHVTDSIITTDSTDYNYVKIFRDYIRDRFYDDVHLSLVKTLIDQFNFHDDKKLYITKSFTDNIVINELVKIVGVKTFEDSISLYEEIKLNLIKHFVENITLQDDVHKVITKTLNDTISLNDIIRIYNVKSFTDSMNIHDEVNLHVTKSHSDHINIDDIINYIIDKNLYETMSLSDSIHTARSKTFSDTINSSDNVKKHVTQYVKDEYSNLRDSKIYDAGVKYDMPVSALTDRIEINII